MRVKIPEESEGRGGEEPTRLDAAVGSQTICSSSREDLCRIELVIIVENCTKFVPVGEGIYKEDW